MNLREKFKRNANFVKPLYRKVKPKETKKDVLVSFDVDRSIKLCGDGFNVSRKVVSDKNDNFNVVSVNKQHNISLPNTSESNIDNVNKVQHKTSRYNTNISNVNTNRLLRDRNMLEILNSSVHNEDNPDDESKRNKIVQHTAKTVVFNAVPNTWLRVYPAPKKTYEAISTIIVRCLLCQMGLASFLVLWTILFVFIIHSIEEPYEAKVSENFQREQNQLVIDLATELRQITPVSPKWRKAIEARIEDERRLTIQAVGKGAKLLPGHFWDLSGTFLFTIYVMTALGFGAPVPQTTWGRTSTLIYAVLAVPIHIYLMVNTSTCVVINSEICMKHMKKYIKDRKFSFIKQKSPNCNRNSEVMKSTKLSILRRKVMRIVQVLCVGRCVPLVTVIYYVVGAVAFGVVRSKTGLEVVMFPLEFTTTGGLDQVKWHVRILYGLYVEGAMSLLAYALASLRRHSSAPINTMSLKYRLFATEHCNECT